MKPDARYQHITDISLDSLSEQGIQGLILDIDNTLCLQGSEEVDPKIHSWLLQARKHGIELFLLSNGEPHRAEAIARTLSAPFLARVGKPSRKGFNKALESLGLQPSSAAVIGDQLFTDILGALRMNIYAILVEPLDRKNEPFVVKIKRPFERLVLVICSQVEKHP